ncbi:MAG: DUF2721 domain-containing protein [Phycisphaerales bacterium]|nr:DUF2721 domain-containing protein [Phycisphaerales bacterium]
MSAMLILAESPFAMLSFLAGPAILTNASTVLALGTANRLARTADRARGAAAAILDSKDRGDPRVEVQQGEFRTATRRTWLLVRALSRFYLAAGLFAAATCIALLGAILDYLRITPLTPTIQVTSLVTVMAGVGGLVHGALILVRETNLAIGAVEQQQAAVRKWCEQNPQSVGALPGS